MNGSRRQGVVAWLAGTVAVLGILGVLGVAAPMATADVVVHPSLPPELPARGYPVIRKTPTYFTVNANCRNGCTVPRGVSATDQSGRFIVSGGDFYEVELQDGTVLQQKYFAAWDITTKQIVCPQKFVFDDEVMAVEPGPTPSTVYVGGRFKKITGADGIARTRNRVALLNLDTCQVDKFFASTGADAKIDEIVRVGNRLFVGGDFTKIGTVSIETVAELDATTGAVNTSFNFPTSGEYTSRIVGMGVSADGTKLVLGGRWGTMTGNGRSIPAPTAVIDITNPAAPMLTAHSSSGYVNLVYLQNAGVSPDGSSIGLAYGTATVADYVYLTSTTLAPVSRTWVHRMRDSSFGIAVSNNAVYVTGHFCYIDAGPGATTAMSAKMGLNVCTGTSLGGNGAWRTHLAALSPVDGTPLAWNPGQDSLVGGKALTVTARGLLSGYDGERTNSIRTGALAFFDFGDRDTTAPVTTIITPPAPVLTETAITITGVATDAGAIGTVVARVRNAAGLYLQDDLTMDSAANDLPVTVTAGARRLSANWSVALGTGLAPDTYTIDAVVTDAAGNVTTAAAAFVVIASPPQITLTGPPAGVDAGTTTLISGTAADNSSIAGVTVRVVDSAGAFLQDDGTFAASPNDLAVSITGLGTPAASFNATAGILPIGTYLIDVAVSDGRFTTVATANHVVNRLLLPPVLTPITDRSDATGAVLAVQLEASDPEGGPLTFATSPLPSGLALDAATGTITGNPVAPGTTPIVVTVTDIDGRSATGTFTWTITGAPLDACAVTFSPAGALVSWKPVAGVASYTVRKNGVFLATVTNGATTSADQLGVVGDSYVLRYRSAGANVDVACIAR